jgi:hypothetical protein
MSFFFFALFDQLLSYFANKRTPHVITLKPRLVLAFLMILYYKMI